MPEIAGVASRSRPFIPLPGVAGMPPVSTSRGEHGEPDAHSAEDIEKVCHGEG